MSVSLGSSLKNVLTFSEMFATWIHQEGNRYENLLVERGFLREEDRGHVSALYDASCAWRKTYIDDLALEESIWTLRSVEEPGLAARSWYLGGWAGWKGYRPSHKRFTTFEDVAQGLIQNISGIPAHHPEDLPRLARKMKDIASQEAYFLLRCGDETAVLKGTHRLSALVYAFDTDMPTPAFLHSVYQCIFPLEKQDIFYRFCEDRPVVFGKYA